MTDPRCTEAGLRDELAKHLEILEPGLTLRSVEYRLPNEHGAAGSVDILATDRYSATVIIELKKSNRTARQALHELHKYVALIKYDHGLRDSQIRCMLVSTEWHELLVPLSEFVRSAPWTADGYQLYLIETGIPERAEKIRPLPAATELHLCCEHKVYLFRDHARRDAAVPALLKLLQKNNLPEYLVLKLDTKRRRFEGACDFALYLIVPEFSPDERKRARDWLAQTHWANRLDELIDYLEEQFVIAEVTDAFFDQCDEREIGYPEKLATECRNFDVVGLIRGGPRLESQAVFSNEYLLRWAKGLEGGNALHFEMIGTPQRRLAWKEAKENAEYCLKGNEAWRTLVQAYLEDIERNHPDATVTARIYNPCNIMMGLYRAAKFNAGDMLASAEVVVSDKDGSPFHVVLGAMVWNGKRVTDIAEVLPDDVPSLFDLYLASSVDGGPWAAEEDLIARHGLSYVLVECTPTPDGAVLQQLVIENGTLSRIQENEQGFGRIWRFLCGPSRLSEIRFADFDSWALFC